MPYRIEGDDVRETRAELVYAWRDPRRVVPRMQALFIGLAGMVGTAVAAMMVSPTVGGGVLVASGGLALWRGLTKDDGAEIRFTVNRGDLVVKGGRVDVHTRLLDLEDVALDTKTIRKVITGKDSTPLASNTSLSPELDQSRIELVITGKDPIALTDVHLAYMHAVEWAGKIRSFLREHGWTPADERDIDEDDD